MEITITEEAVQNAAKMLDDGYAVHPGWAAAFAWGLAYSEKKERAKQEKATPTEKTRIITRPCPSPPVVN